jgi:hypothetical protein
VSGYHHRPTALSDNNRMLVTLVYIADTMCCVQKRGFNLTACRQKYDDAGIIDLQIDSRLIEQTAGRMDELVSSATSVLG